MLCHMPNKCIPPHHFTPVTRENKKEYKVWINNNKYSRLDNEGQFKIKSHCNTPFYFPWRMGRSLVYRYIP